MEPTPGHRGALRGLLLAFGAMSPLLIVFLVLAVGVVVAALALNPMLLKKQDESVRIVKEVLGADNIVVIEPRTTAMGTEPEEAGGLRGMGCLAASSSGLMFVTWAGSNRWRLPRSAITKVETEADDPTNVAKLTLHIHHTHAGEDAVAHFRLADPVPWLKELGYDWGEAGPPPDDPDDDDEVGG